MGVRALIGSSSHRALFRAQLDRAAIDDIRLALNQSPPLGNKRFYVKIEQMTGIRREAEPRMDAGQSTLA